MRFDFKSLSVFFVVVFLFFSLFAGLVNAGVLSFNVKPGSQGSVVTVSWSQGCPDYGLGPDQCSSNKPLYCPKTSKGKKTIVLNYKCIYGSYIFGPSLVADSCDNCPETYQNLTLISCDPNDVSSGDQVINNCQKCGCPSDSECKSSGECKQCNNPCANNPCNPGESCRVVDLCAGTYTCESSSGGGSSGGGSSGGGSSGGSSGCYTRYCTGANNQYCRSVSVTCPGGVPSCTNSSDC